MESNREERTVQQTALNNPIILTEILKRTSNQLKSCRLVSHFWNDIVLSLPNTRLVFKLNKNDEIYIEDDQFFELCFTLDDRLAKRIGVKGHTPSLDWRLMHCCDKFSDHVQILRISVKDETCLKSIYQVLKNCCPNLKELRIRGKFMQGNNQLDLAGILSPKPNLTLFTVKAELVTPFLATLVQLVVSASPNLRGVTLSWGLFPDFTNSKFLDTLTIVLDDVDPRGIIRAESKLAELARLLGQVGDQLVTLNFANDGCNLMKTLPPNGYQLPAGKLAKLQNFRNDMIDVFQCDDLFKNIEMLPSLKTLDLAPALHRTTHVDEIWRNICNSKKTSGSMRSLEVHDMYDSRLLYGLTKAFPALERFRMDTYYETIADEEVNRMEFGMVLKACAGWKRLKHLDLELPTYPGQMVDFIQSLLQGRELFQWLTTLEINAHEGLFSSHELTLIELDMFKELILAMDGMEQVTMFNVFLTEESVANVLTFMASNNLDVAKFRLQQGSSYW